jgi:hypothetical protein
MLCSAPERKKRRRLRDATGGRCSEVTIDPGSGRAVTSRAAALTTAADEHQAQRAHLFQCQGDLGPRNSMADVQKKQPPGNSMLHFLCTQTRKCVYMPVDANKNSHSSYD